MLRRVPDGRLRRRAARRHRPSLSLTHPQHLEAESIQIFREVVAEREKPAMLYSIGKDSSLMLHLARKAFYAPPPPFPLVHVDGLEVRRDVRVSRPHGARERHGADRARVSLFAAQIGLENITAIPISAV